MSNSKRCHIFRRHIANGRESHRHHSAQVNSARYCSTCSVMVCYLKFLQDASATRGPCSRTAHRLKLSGIYLRREYITFIEPPNTWPRIAQKNSHAAWVPFRSNMQCTAGDDSLQRRSFSMCVSVWSKLLQRFIDRAINEWHRQLECVVRQQGRCIETLNLNKTVKISVHSHNLVRSTLSNITVILNVICKYTCFELLTASRQYA